MKAALVAAVALAGMAAVGEARAQEAEVRAFYNGNQLLAFCESRTERDVGTCLGIIAGAADMLSEISAPGGNFSGFRACIPKSATAGQARDVVVRELRAHPENRNYTAASLAADALARAFPCR
jgi:hypothetical protein